MVVVVVVVFVIIIIIVIVVVVVVVVVVAIISRYKYTKIYMWSSNISLSSEQQYGSNNSIVFLVLFVIMYLLVTETGIKAVGGVSSNGEGGLSPLKVANATLNTGTFKK